MRIILLGLLFIALAACTEDREKQAMRFYGSLRTFGTLFLEYKKDAQASGLPEDHWLPNDLNDFISSGYISTDDFKKLTKGFKIEYFRPKDISDKSPILMIEVEDWHGDVFTDGSYKTLKAVPFKR
jgi:hypothetical protein